MYCVLADAKTETELSVPIKEMKCIIQSFVIHKVLFFFYKMPKIKDFIYMLQMFNYVERLLFYLGYNMLKFMEKNDYFSDKHFKSLPLQSPDISWQ